jgi:hypothetical protein
LKENCRIPFSPMKMEFVFVGKFNSWRPSCAPSLLFYNALTRIFFPIKISVLRN